MRTLGLLFLVLVGCGPASKEAAEPGAQALAQTSPFYGKWSYNTQTFDISGSRFTSGSTICTAAYSFADAAQPTTMTAAATGLVSYAQGVYVCPAGMNPGLCSTNQAQARAAASAQAANFCATYTQQFVVSIVGGTLQACLTPGGQCYFYSRVN